MSWNYRIMKHEEERRLHRNASIVKFTWYAIHEVYYNDDKIGYTKDSTNLSADTLEDLKSTYEMIGEAFNKPVLDYKNE